MRSITNIIIKFIELLEAEGRSFRSSAVATAENIAVIVFAMFMVFAGVAAAFFSLYLWLSIHIGKVGGSAVIAALLVAGGGCLLSAAHSKGLKGEPFFTRKPTEKTPAPAEESGDEQ